MVLRALRIRNPCLWDRRRKVRAAQTQQCRLAAVVPVGRESRRAPLQICRPASATHRAFLNGIESVVSQESLSVGSQTEGQGCTDTAVQTGNCCPCGEGVVASQESLSVGSQTEGQGCTDTAVQTGSCCPCGEGVVASQESLSVGTQTEGQGCTDTAVQTGSCCPCGEGVEESTITNMQTRLRNPPTYRLRELDVSSATEGTLYDQWNRDPRLFYMSPPSNFGNGYAARLLHQARQETQGHPQLRAASTLPRGTGYVERIESLSLPDGRTYRLSARWMVDRHVQQLQSMGTQCDFRHGPALV